MVSSPALHREVLETHFQEEGGLLGPLPRDRYSQVHVNPVKEHPGEIAHCQLLSVECEWDRQEHVCMS